ncbi:hypothetical protein KCP73_24190 [Salmonella enterica subsp. enterica]|nr:hypothetical protein KCP73_24190 [Salmonella enterica subsp. enterica]
MAERLGDNRHQWGEEDTVARRQQFTTDDMGADIVFETAGSAVTTQAPYLVMRGGKIMIVGTVAEIQRLISSKLTVKSPSRRRPAMPTAIR